MNNLIIVGAGGFGLEVAAYANDIAQTGKIDFVIRGFLDDYKIRGEKHAGFPVLGDTDSVFQKDASYIIAVGTPETRKSLAQKLAGKGANFATLTHPQSYVADSAKIGAGTIIAPFTFVGPAARIGKHCLLNTHVCAGHEITMGDYCVVSPQATIHGKATLGAGVFVGGHACVTAKKHVGGNAKISAGAVVYNDIPADHLAIGNPAMFRKSA